MSYDAKTFATVSETVGLLLSVSRLGMMLSWLTPCGCQIYEDGGLPCMFGFLRVSVL